MLLWPLLAFPQTTMVVYDGITGINNVTIRDDTAVIINLIPRSPASKAGMNLRDQILSINDSVVAGTGMTVNGIKRLLEDSSGKSIELKIKRKGEDEILTFAFERDPRPLRRFERNG